MKEQPLVLVIEDNEALRETLCDNLKSKGYNLFGAKDGGKALKFIKEVGRPSIVITDIFMPEVDGLEIISYLRKNLPETKIIAISGGYRTLASANVLNVAKSLGVAAIFEKPFDFRAVNAKIKQLLEDDE